MTRTHGPGSGHPPSCFGCRVLGVNIAPSATPTRSDAAARNASERAMTRDIGAYRALRRDGLQPASVMGAGDLAATATSAAQIEGRPR